MSSMSMSASMPKGSRLADSSPGCGCCASVAVLASSFCRLAAPSSGAIMLAARSVGKLTGASVWLHCLQLQTALLHFAGVVERTCRSFSPGETG